MLVVLRLALGCHFLYEGVWKIRHAALFVGETEGFLSGARGPIAGFFYGMVPDIDGHQRLEANLSEIDGNTADGKPTKSIKLAKSWDDLRQRFVDYYRPADGKDDSKELHSQLSEASQKVYERHVQGLKKFVAENGDKIKAHFESLKRYQEGLKTDPGTTFQKQRRWDEMQDLRKEAKAWMADLDARENALKGDLLDLLNKDRKSEVVAVALADRGTAEKGAKKAAEAEVKKPAATETKKAEPAKSLAADKAKTKAEDKSKEVADVAVVVVDFSPLAENHAASGAFAPSANPLAWKRIEQLAFLLTWSLFGIGLCLMLGLFTRPAALAGAGFMLFVVLSQPSYPGVYPLDPPQLGHALLVNKDFVEMISLLVIASTSLGRWTGLDFFVHNYLVKPFCGNCCNHCSTEGRKA